MNKVISYVAMAGLISLAIYTMERYCKNFCKLPLRSKLAVIFGLLIWAPWTVIYSVMVGLDYVQASMLETIPWLDKQGFNLKRSREVK